MIQCIECNSGEVVAFVKHEGYKYSDGSSYPDSYVAVCKEHYELYISSE